MRLALNATKGAALNQEVAILADPVVNSKKKPVLHVTQPTDLAKCARALVAKAKSIEAAKDHEKALKRKEGERIAQLEERRWYRQLGTAIVS